MEDRNTLIDRRAFRPDVFGVHVPEGGLVVVVVQCAARRELLAVVFTAISVDESSSPVSGEPQFKSPSASHGKVSSCE